MPWFIFYKEKSNRQKPTLDGLTHLMEFPFLKQSHQSNKGMFQVSKENHLIFYEHEQAILLTHDRVDMNSSERAIMMLATQDLSFLMANLENAAAK
jgi:hypothetical protein